jgi:hypothetical protein
MVREAVLGDASEVDPAHVYRNAGPTASGLNAKTPSVRRKFVQFQPVRDDGNARARITAARKAEDLCLWDDWRKSFPLIGRASIFATSTLFGHILAGFLNHLFGVSAPGRLSAKKGFSI